jgi:hypothetical protein
MPMATGRAELLGAKKKDLGDDFSESWKTRFGKKWILSVNFNSIILYYHMNTGLFYKSITKLMTVI